MAEETKVTVPIGLSEGPAQPAQEQEKPLWARKSLHTVRMPRREVQQTETAPQWVDNPGGQGGRFEYRPVERQAEPIQATSPPPQSAPANDAISQQLSQLTNAVTLLAQHQLGIEPDRGPLMPNPVDFDFYDPQQEGEYHQALQKYVEETVQQRLQSEFEPYKPVLADVQKQRDMQAQFDACVAEHGESANFRTVMSQALHMVADSGGQLSIKDAFARANSQDNKPGERGGHLSQAHAKSKFPKFGQILLDNQLSGRASAPPPRKRGW